MLEQERIDLINYRIQTANEMLEASQAMIGLKMFKSSINRSYYSVFHAIRALLAIDGVDFKKHSGVISYFSQQYIKTETFDKIFGEYISKLSIFRNESDYDDFFIVSKEEAEEQSQRAKVIVISISEYLDKTIGLNHSK